jgi:hypothetical protein
MADSAQTPDSADERAQHKTGRRKRKLAGFRAQILLLRRRQVRGSEKEWRSPYWGWKPLAHRIKVALQMIVGGSAVVILAYRTLGSRTFLPAEDVITLIGNALATAAVIELAYTLFTPGPDEALDPLMLGLAAALLVAFAHPDTFNYQNAIAALLVIIGLAILYGIRRSLDRPGTKQDIEEQDKQSK